MNFVEMMPAQAVDKEIAQYLALDSGLEVLWSEDIPTCLMTDLSPAIQANSYYFDHPKWAKNYLKGCHRYPAFKARWQAAMGNWDGKIVVDVGCGPGNLYASIKGSPKIIIGVDVSRGALGMAQKIGYKTILADAHHLPFISNFADIVALNATLHHCEDMTKVLASAARMVRPGGILIIDHDPQLSAWNYKGLGMFFYNTRLPIYKFFLRKIHMAKEERTSMLATEIHHKPGDGVTPELFHQTLEPLNFTVKLYPHNNTAGAEVLQGDYGQPPHWRYRIGQILSGIDPNTKEAALSLMCVATRNS